MAPFPRTEPLFSTFLLPEDSITSLRSSLFYLSRSRWPHFVEENLSLLPFRFQKASFRRKEPFSSTLPIAKGPISSQRTSLFYLSDSKRPHFVAENLSLLPFCFPKAPFPCRDLFSFTFLLPEARAFVAEPHPFNRNTS